MSFNKAFDEGYTAQRQCKSENANPYKYDSWHYWEWNSGWSFAREEYLEALNDYIEHMNEQMEGKQQ